MELCRGTTLSQRATSILRVALSLRPSKSGSQTSNQNNMDKLRSSNLTRRALSFHNPEVNLQSSDVPFLARVGTRFGPHHSTNARPRRIQVTI